MSNPFDQFAIKSLIDLDVLGYKIDFTNSSAFMMLVGFLICSILFLSVKDKKMIPNRMQSAGEILFEFVEDMLVENVGEIGRRYFNFVFSVFLFVIISNLLGMIPYSFTVTSHISITFALAIAIFIIVNIIAFAIHGIKFLSFFLPSGTPLWLAPLMVLIELFSYLARPVSLSIRLAANMIAGHVLLKLIAGFVIMMGLFFGIIPIPLLVILTGFEIFVAILQAYIFTMLTCVYINDAVNLH